MRINRSNKFKLKTIISESSKPRQDIQALRGVAILAVLAFHLNSKMIPNGFYGVDIFFVISGYLLIPPLLSKKIGKQEIFLFYLRRCKRILPSSLLAIIITLIVFHIILGVGRETRQLTIQSIFATIFSVNIFFTISHLSYIRTSESVSPFIHFWSLGVEEQTYLILPIIATCCRSLFKKRPLLLFLVVSFLSSVLWSSTHTVSGFYLPLTRLWEFLLGAGAAQISVKSKFKGFIAYLAIFGIVLSFFAGEQVLRPSWFSLVPTLSATLFLSAKSDSEFRYIRNIGDFSFAAYLIHWPIITFFLDRGIKINFYSAIIILALTYFLSFLMTRFVERPFRFGRFSNCSLKNYITAVVVFLTILIVTLYTIDRNQLEQPVSNGVRIDSSLPSTYYDGCHLYPGIDWPKHDCSFGDRNSTESIVLAGDSHAAQWFPAFVEISKVRKLTLYNWNKSSCPPIVLDIQLNQKLDSSCRKWVLKLAEHINLLNPTKLILSSFTEYDYPLQTSTGSYPSTFLAGQKRFLDLLKIPKAHIFILGDTPHPLRDIPVCLRQNAKHYDKCAFPNSQSETSILMRSFAKREGVNFIDGHSLLCSKAICEAQNGQINLYRDSSHISNPESLQLASKLEAKLIFLERGK
jgi:peptidoglycan/LPS O-acetylase OafA/YrhL